MLLLGFFQFFSDSQKDWVKQCIDQWDWKKAAVDREEQQKKVKTQQRKMKKEKSENDVVDIDLLLTATDQV